MNIKIPEPCHESWKGMSRTEKGRFCQSCEKEVVDFSRMSRPQIIETLGNSSTAICGRFRNDQLEQTPTPKHQITHKRLLFSAIRKGWAAVLATVVGLFSVVFTKSNALQGNIAFDWEELNIHEAKLNFLMHELRVKVVDENDMPVKGARIIVAGVQDIRPSMLTDEDGMAIFDLEGRKSVGTELDIITYSTSYPNKRVSVPLLNKNTVSVEVRLVDLPLPYVIGKTMTSLEDEVSADSRHVATTAVELSTDIEIASSKRGDCDKREKDYMAESEARADFASAESDIPITLGFTTMGEPEFEMEEDIEPETIEHVDSEVDAQVYQISVPVVDSVPHNSNHDTYATINDDAINKTDSPDLLLFPNPARDIVRLKTTMTGPLTYQIFSSSGYLVQKGLLSAGERAIGLEKMASGSYILNIMNRKGSTTSVTLIVE